MHFLVLQRRLRFKFIDKAIRHLAPIKSADVRVPKYISGPTFPYRRYGSFSPLVALGLRHIAA